MNNWCHSCDVFTAISYRFGSAGSRGCRFTKLPLESICLWLHVWRFFLSPSRARPCAHTGESNEEIRLSAKAPFWIGHQLKTEVRLWQVVSLYWCPGARLRSIGWLLWEGTPVTGWDSILMLTLLINCMIHFFFVLLKHKGNTFYFSIFSAFGRSKLFNEKYFFIKENLNIFKKLTFSL